MAIDYFVYILSNNEHTVFYTGMTSNLKRRISQHRLGQPRSFTKKYQVYKLVYFERLDDRPAAILREKKIKDSPRNKRMEMVHEFNPEWADLFDSL